MQQENRRQESLTEQELSEVWRELLNSQPATDTDGTAQADSTESTIPTLDSDPWSELLQAKGVEIVDLHKLQLHMSDQDVEQLLQLMQEQATHTPE
jgi:hypothetical protein